MEDEVVWEEDDSSLVEAIEISLLQAEMVFNKRNNEGSNQIKMDKLEKSQIELVDSKSLEPKKPFSSNNEEQKTRHDDSLLCQNQATLKPQMKNVKSIFENKKDITNPINRMSHVVKSKLVKSDPKISELFNKLDKSYFNGKLTKSGVQVDWSKEITTCTGLCKSYHDVNCLIRLSQPLLRNRPQTVLVETLLHEMIHALLLVTNQDHDHEFHSEAFHRNMRRINREGSYNITVDHTFHELHNDERYIWKCNGSCNKFKPFYGLIRRTTNRPPGPEDSFYSEHEKHCNGTFIKIFDRENKFTDQYFDTKNALNGKRKNANKEMMSIFHQNDIRKYFKPLPKESNSNL